jgi:hypothetical protein
MVYVVGGTQHTMLSRSSSAQNDGVAAAHFQALANSLQVTMGTNVTFVGVEVAAQGSNVFNPIGGFTPVTGTAGAVAPVDFPRAVCFPGRTTNGRKTKVFLFGVSSAYVTPATYEEDPLVKAEFQGMQGLLNSQSDFWLGIDGVKPSWYFRCTVKTNDHYVDAAR